MSLKGEPSGKENGPWIIKGGNKPASAKNGIEVFRGKKSDNHSDQSTQKKAQ